MIYERFDEKRFQPRSMELINIAADILEEYAAQNYVLTLRQLYYQFVSRNVIPNTERSYKNLGGLITDARMAGFLPWDGIEDRNRGKSGWLIEEDIDGIIAELPRNYAKDMWANQDYYVEVWVEKEALSNVVQRACQTRRVPYMACKGYLSASEAWRAGRRMRLAASRGKQPVIIHLGDHDPSGLDMTRDNNDRANLFARSEVTVERIALNMDQIDQYSPPPNPAKVSDSRAADYIDRYGSTSWELDALEPSVVVELIRDAVEKYIHPGVWDEDLEEEAEQKKLLRAVGTYWGEVKDLLWERMEDDE